VILILILMLVVPARYWLAKKMAVHTDKQLLTPPSLASISSWARRLHSPPTHPPYHRQ